MPEVLNGICEGGYYGDIGVKIYKWLEAVVSEKEGSTVRLTRPK